MGEQQALSRDIWQSPIIGIAIGYSCPPYFKVESKIESDSMLHVYL